jgi:hypothetical protein
MTTSNISKLDFVKMDNNDNNEINVEHILLSNTVNDFVKNETKMDSNIKVKLLLKGILKAKGESATNTKTEIPTTDFEAAKKVNEVISRSTNPINEFMHNDKLFLSSFPLLFLLGEGWYCKGSAKQDYLLHLFRQYDHRFGRDQRLVYYVILYYIIYIIYYILYILYYIFYNILDLFLLC